MPPNCFPAESGEEEEMHSKCLYLRSPNWPQSRWLGLMGWIGHFRGEGREIGI